CFSLKYAWELQIYFALYVFPFLNDLFTDRRFVLAFLRQFSRLGPWNRGLQQMLSGFYSWKKAEHRPVEGPRFLDFNEIGNLSRAEKTFYEVGVGVGEAKRILAQQMVHLEETARFLATHIMAVVLDEPAVYTSRAFVESLELDSLSFDPESFRRRWAEHRDDPRTWEWTFCHKALDRFRTEARKDAHEVLKEVAS
ncbi:MAG: hypothetical protein MI919_41245, partial [Holophagales bacterium]|nr:hypothetical protein [Holophagales bacterium]